MRRLSTASLITMVLLLGATALQAQGRGNGRGTGSGNAPEMAPGLERQVHQVPEPATLTLLGLALGGGLVATGWHAARRRRR